MPTPTTPDPHQPADAKAGRQRAAVEARRAAARAFAARTRAAQGLPRHVQDPEVIAELIMLFRPAPGDRQPAEHHHGGEHLPGAASPSTTPSAG
jgi:hypothetical protein